MKTELDIYDKLVFLREELVQDEQYTGEGTIQTRILKEQINTLSFAMHNYNLSMLNDELERLNALFKENVFFTPGFGERKRLIKEKIKILEWVLNDTPDNKIGPDGKIYGSNKDTVIVNLECFSCGHVFTEEIIDLDESAPMIVYRCPNCGTVLEFNNPNYIR